MKIISRPVWMLAYFGITLTVVCIGIGGWLSARPRPVVAERPATTDRSPATCAHCGGVVQFDLLTKLLADDRRSAPENAWLRELADPKAALRVETQSHPLLGQPAPDFTLDDHGGHSWRLREQLVRGPVVLVFYLGYYCNGCVHDLFELNADLERFHRLGAEVVAVSGDAPDITRQRFEEFGVFGFPVLSDPGHVVARIYGTYQPAARSKSEELLHGTFLIARDGRVHWVSRGSTPFRANMALLYELVRLEHGPQELIPDKRVGTVEPKQP